MNLSDSETSYDYMENLELDAFNWTAGLIGGGEFFTRNNYQQKFLLKQYARLLNKLDIKFRR